jgi:hypothetical protein
VYEEVLTLGAFPPLSIPPFEYKELEPDQAAPADAQSFGEAETGPTLDEISKLAPKACVDQLVAKVAWVSPTKQSKYSPFKTISVKDSKNQVCYNCLS